MRPRTWSGGFSRSCHVACDVSSRRYTRYSMARIRPDAGRRNGLTRTGQISSVELTTRMLARITQHNPRLNAIVTLTEDSALARARAANEARARGEWWGPFHGVPCTIKDTYEVTGVRTTAGMPTLKDHVPPRDAVVVARLKRAGVVILGKTNVP